MSCQGLINKKNLVCWLFLTISFVCYFIIEETARIKDIAVDYSNNLSVILESDLENIQNSLNIITNEISVLNADPYIINHIFNRYKDTNNQKYVKFTNLGFVDHNCLIIVNASHGVYYNPILINQDYCHKTRKQPYILHLNPLINRNIENYTIPAAIGVIGQDSKYMGALTLDLQFDSLDDIVYLPEYISYQITDKNNMNLIASDKIFSQFQSMKQIEDQPYYITVAVNSWYVILQYMIVTIPAVIILTIIYVIILYFYKHILEYLQNRKKGTFEVISKKYNRQKTDIIEILVEEFGIIQNMNLAKFEFTIYDSIPKIYICRPEFIYVINNIIHSILAPNIINDISVMLFIKYIDNKPYIHIKIRNNSNNYFQESPLVSQDVIKEIMSQYYDVQDSNFEVITTDNNMEIKIYLAI